MKNALIGSVVTLAALAIIAVIVALSGVVNVGADSPPPALVEWVLENTMHRSVASRAADIEVPDLDDPAILVEGASHYDAMCVSCHGAPGVDPGEIAQGLSPTPPELASHESSDPATLFWVTKHGVMMTGMPAWGTSHDDASLWGMVALMSRFDEMSPEEYRKLVASSEGHDHGGHDHGGGDGHDDGRPEAEPTPPSQPTADGDDDAEAPEKGATPKPEKPFDPVHDHAEHDHQH